MAEEADAATAAWREEMAVATTESDGGGQPANRAGDEVLQILLAARQQCLRDPAARDALLQLHAWGLAAAVAASATTVMVRANLYHAHT